MTLVILGKYILTMNPKREIIKDGVVVVEDDKIIDIGRKDLKKKYKADVIVDARNKLVMPGLVDCHIHLSQGLSRGLGDDIDFRTWLNERIYPYEAALDSDETYVSSLLCCLEMIRTGTTTFADPGAYRVDGCVKAVEEAGLRGVVSYPVQDVQGGKWPVPKELLMTSEEAIKRTEKLIRRFNGRAKNRIRVWGCLRADAHVSRELVKEMVNLVREYRVGVEMHAATDKNRVELLKKREGTGIIGYLDSLNALGPDWLMTHMVWLEDEELRILKKRGVNVCHAPGSSLHGTLGASSRGKFPEMVKMGINVCLGCDATSANNGVDLFRDVYLAATIHKEARCNPFLISPEQAIEMATVNGAKALMNNQIGSLEKGKKAEIITLDINGSNWVPLHDFSLVPTLVYSGNGRDVSTVIVDGKVLMENRRFKTLDAQKVLNDAQKVTEKILKRIGVKIKPKWPINQ